MKPDLQHNQQEQTPPLQPTTPKPPRSLQFGLFFSGCLWLFVAQALAASAAKGICLHFNLSSVEPVLEQAFRLFLLLTGFSALGWIGIRHGNTRESNALPKRSTSAQEWQRGAALGWGMLLIAVLPMVLAGSLHPTFWLAPRSWGLAILSLVVIAITTLAIEVGFRGFLYGRLIAAIGVSSATFFMSLIYAAIAVSLPNATLLSVAASFMMGILLSIAYLRTHGLWLGWGIHFAWNAAMGVLLGLPVAGFANYSSLVSTDSTGPNWLSGGPYGPEAAAFSVVVMIAAIPALYRITRDYEWEYTHPPIVAAGYAMEIAPPAAHTAMENAAAAAPVPLVQILGSTPTASSTMPEIDEHLRKQSETTPDE